MRYPTTSAGIKHGILLRPRQTETLYRYGLKYHHADGQADTRHRDNPRAGKPGAGVVTAAGGGFGSNINTSCSISFNSKVISSASSIRSVRTQYTHRGQAAVTPAAAVSQGKAVTTPYAPARSKTTNHHLNPNTKAAFDFDFAKPVGTAASTAASIRAASVRAQSIKAQSIKAPSIKAVSIKSISLAKAKAVSVKSLPARSLPVPAARAVPTTVTKVPSPAPSIIKVAPTSKIPRVPKCEPTTTPPVSRPNSRKGQLAPTPVAAATDQPKEKKTKQPAASRRLVPFTDTRKLQPMPIMMVEEHRPVHAVADMPGHPHAFQHHHHMAGGGGGGNGGPGGGGDPVMPLGQLQFDGDNHHHQQALAHSNYNYYNYNHNVNINHQQNQPRRAGATTAVPGGGAGITSPSIASSVNGAGNSNRPNSPALSSQAGFPPRRDSKKGSTQQHRRPSPPASTSHPNNNSASPNVPSDWPLDSGQQHTQTRGPIQPRRHPLQRQLSHPNAPPRRSHSPGRPPASGANSNTTPDHDRDAHLLNGFPPVRSYTPDLMSNASPQRSSPVPFENIQRQQRPPPNGPTNFGPFPNSHPKGLRIRTGPAPPHIHTQNRGRTTPDQRFDRNGRHPEESGMRSPIIQMPLAFNKIASRQDQSRSSSPTTRSPIEGFHSLTSTRPADRRPTILRAEVSSSEERSSPRGTPESLVTSPRLEEITSHPISAKPSASSPELRQKRSQSPFPDSHSFNESPSAVNRSFRTALKQTGLADAGTRSSIVTNNSATTTSASEIGDVSGEMSVEDAIGMYESDDDDWDPTEVPVIDRTKRTDSGTPVEETAKPVSMKEDRMSRSGLADFLIKQREEAASPSSPTTDERGVSLVLESGINLEAELHDAQNNEWEAITDKRRSAQAEPAPPHETEIIDDWSEISRPAPDDTPPRYPPMKPSAPRDRYGFRTETQYVTAAEYNGWNSKYEDIMVRRKKKWSSLLKEAGLTPLDNEVPIRFPPRSQKVKRFVRKGIPPEWRGNAWWFYASGQKYVSKNPGLYDKLVAQGAPTDSEAPELIERDLHRTHPDNIHFKPDQKPILPNGTKPTKHKQSNSKIVETPIIKSLRRVLTAFAVYVPRIGYCQSLNFWAGMLLLFMDEEKAFWMLYIITHQYLPGTHERSLEGSNIDQAVLMMAVKDAMPNVWAKISLCLDGTSVSFNNSKLPDITLCTASWLMSGFISNLPIETVLRVWDSFFYEGSKILFRVSLGLFKIAEPAIKAVNDPVEVFQIVQTTPRKCIDAGALMDLCFKRRNGYGHLSQDDIDHRRRERKEMLEREKRAMNDGHPRSSKDDLSIRKGFARELLEEGEDNIRRFRNFIKR
ncbi:hypothetical protein Dda_6570 [Drechslerella dactyloides]|uniref:Rab-GAP TBC domain-containing protein n=1 Tax=Drechslerella dactyloides TaxID=74499 RepID=A0AAD6IXL6_DREDA|nr:hypothetical protein Dda_6570 [Drechslerella dactyloides]